MSKARAYLRRGSVALQASCEFPREFYRFLQATRSLEHADFYFGSTWELTAHVTSNPNSLAHRNLISTPLSLLLIDDKLSGVCVEKNNIVVFTVQYKMRTRVAVTTPIYAFPDPA